MTGVGLKTVGTSPADDRADVGSASFGNEDEPPDEPLCRPDGDQREELEIMEWQHLRQ